MATLVLMPRLSPTMEEGTLAKWTKKVGDKISPGDVIAEVETDKANMDFPLEDEGVLLQLLVKEGETVKLGAPVAVLGEAGEDPAKAIAEAKPAAPSAPKTEAAPSPVEKEITKPLVREISNANANTNANATGRIKASPLAKKIAADRGIALTSLAGSGPGGRIVAKDLDGASSSVDRRAPRSIINRQDELLPASQMRKTIAKRLTAAKLEVPHIYLTVDADAEALMNLREQYLEATGTKISVNDLVVKAFALALARVPDANVSWTNEGILRHGRVDIGVAVSIPDGLITPVLRNADQRAISELSAEMKELAGRAKNKKLKPEEYTGATASLSNLGMFGVREFTAIINPPEAVILAVGATDKRAVVVSDERGDRIEIRRRMTLTLSCDHRVVDGVLGAQLLAEVKKILEKPLAVVL